MFGPGGFAYVYLSYGIHELFNISAEKEGHGAAVLIRAIEPEIGVEEMRERRPGRSDRELSSGPGRLTLAMGINLSYSGADVLEPPFELFDTIAGVNQVRVAVDQAGDNDAAAAIVHLAPAADFRKLVRRSDPNDTAAEGGDGAAWSKLELTGQVAST